MGDRSQDQNMEDLGRDGQQTQAGRDAIALQHSPGAQVIRQSYWSLFGNRTTAPGIDWDWAMRILKQQQPDIKKRLKDSLFGLAEMDAVEMESKRQEESPALALEAKKTLTVNGQDAGTIDPQAPIIATYAREDIDGSLLILGTPGAGKTITLLKLAEQLVGEAIAQPQTVIPIIFELSTWRDGQEIEAWLIEQLYENYGGNRKRKIYETWVERRVLLPLLDGLDELGMARQKACTEAVNEFAKHWKVVVCCRVKEFQQAGVNPSNLRGKVQLQPLSDRQIERYLDKMEKSGLWEQIQSVPEMGKLLEPVIDKENADYDEPGLLRVPLFISLAAQVYEQDKPLKGKKDLFERYIDRQLSWDVRVGDRDRKEFKGRQWTFKTVEKEPDRRNVWHSLGWIAQQLQQRNQVEFLIEKMQPSCLCSDIAQRQYRMIFGVIIGLITGMIFGMVFGLIIELIIGLAMGVTFGMIFGVISAQVDNIEPIEGFRKIPMMHEVLREQFYMALHFLILVLFTWLEIYLLGLLIPFLRGDLRGEQIAWAIGLLILSISGGLIASLIDELKQDLKIRSKPNQGIWNSLESIVWVTILCYPLGSIFYMTANVTRHINERGDWFNLLGILLRHNPQFLLSGVIGVLSSGFFIGGGFAIIQHICLRFIITRHHKIPWNIARFLTYCHDRRLLQQIGGRYRFIHRELLEHFAKMEN